MPIKIPKGIVKQGLNLAKTGAGKAIPFASKHAKEILGGVAGLLAIDNIRMRIQKRSDRKAQEKKDIETQAALRKEEAKIKDLEAAVNASEYIQNVNNLAASNEDLQQVVKQQDETIKKMRANAVGEEVSDETQKR